MNKLTVVLRAGTRQPAIGVATAGVLLLVALFAAPPLASFTPFWPALAALVAVSWLALAATQVQTTDLQTVRYSRGNRDPFMVRAIERRDALAAEVQELTMATVQGVAADALQKVDADLLPQFETRVRRHRALEDALRQHANGKGPLTGATAANIARLTALADQQRQALEGTLGRLSDMTASLMGLSQEGDQSALADQAREWADDLGTYWQATEEVFRTSRFPGGDASSR